MRRRIVCLPGARGKALEALRERKAATGEGAVAMLEGAKERQAVAGAPHAAASSSPATVTWPASTRWRTRAR